MNFTFLLSALRARNRLFLLILTTTVLAAIVITMLVPKTYIAKVSLLMDGRDEQSLRSSAPLGERERLGYLQTQVDILTSPRVAQRVIRDLRLTDDATLRADHERSASPASFENWLGDLMLKRLKVDSSQSSVVNLTFSADDPQFAAQVANGFARAYVDTVLELRVEPMRQTTAWFSEQLKTLREGMEQADQRLIEFQKQNNIVSTDERYDVDQLQLAELAGRMARSGGTATPRSNSGSGAASVAGIDSESGSLRNLRAEVVRSETKLQELSAELGNRHPAYQRKLSEFEALRAELERETQRDNLQSRQRRDQLAGAMTAHSARMLERKRARSQLAILVSEAASAQRTYDAAMQRFLSSKIESGAVSTNVSVMNQAIAPSSPARPILALNVAIAFVIGLLLALTTVHMLESADRRVRLIEDLDGNPRIPLLAELKAFDPSGERRLLASFPRNALPGPG
jgi:chain length determinant protein EpsF